MKIGKVSQVAHLDDTETIVRIDYGTKEIVIYSCRASVLNRMTKLGYEPEQVDKHDGKIYGATYRFPNEMIGKFLRTGIFQYK